MNGIDIENFNPRRSDVLGSLHVKDDLSDLEDKKKEAMKVLYHEGIIADSEKPIFLYVGRFSSEKGIDALDLFIDKVLQHGGQVVIMGTDTTDTAAKKEIDRLQEKVKNQEYGNHSKLVKIYRDVAKDQIAPLNGVNAKKGNVIRFASEFTFVPSTSEACGLMPMENLAFGSGVITSYIQGLKDMCRPYGVKGLEGRTYDKSDFNSFSFLFSTDRSTTMHFLDKDFDSAMNVWQKMSSEEKIEAKKRWIRESSAYAWPITVDKYKQELYDPVLSK
jgi:glycogen synthase